MNTTLAKNIEDHLNVMRDLGQLEPVLNEACAKIVASIQHGGKVMLCGNGGSAADAQHIAAEFTGRFIKDRPPIAAVALSTDSSALTCIGNDYSFDDVFIRQLQALGRTGDCLIGISTSGNSRNVIKAVEHARANGILTIGLLGRDGGKLGPLCDLSITVKSDVTARIQECHILLAHTICGIVEESLGLV